MPPRPSPPDSFREDFFARSPQAASLMRLFDALPQTYFFAKNRESRFVAVNHMFLDNHGLVDESQAIGKSDRDFPPPLMAEAYIRTTPRWYVCTKTPLFDPDETVVGIAGAMYRIDDPHVLAGYFQELMPVVQHVDRHYAAPISIADMAALAGLSSTHFNRRFRHLLRMTPSQYLRTVRVQHARGLLTTTDKPLAEIAALTGFTDQSHFTRRFRETTGLTPDAYRRRFRQ